MARLPQPGSDQGVWGEVLNDYLLQAHAPTGMLKNDIVGEANLTVAARTKLNAYTTKADVASLATVATTGSYGDLSDRPGLAAVATSGSYDDLDDRPSLTTVATTGSYNDLSDRPVIPKITLSASAPINPSIGDMWVDLSA